MQIQNRTNTPFNGILIENTTFEEVRNIAMNLRFRGFHPLGYKRYYLSHGDTYGMMKKAREIRTKGFFGIPNEFGTLYFPWSRAAYLIAPRKIEPAIYKEVVRLNPDAVFNMLA